MTEFDWIGIGLVAGFFFHWMLEAIYNRCDANASEATDD